MRAETYLSISVSRVNTLLDGKDARLFLVKYSIFLVKYTWSAYSVVGQGRK